MKALAHDEDYDYENIFFERDAEEDEHATNVCVDGSNPTEFDLALAHDVIWKL